jgi:hypothetical protein
MEDAAVLTVVRLTDFSLVLPERVVMAMVVKISDGELTFRMRSRRPMRSTKIELSARPLSYLRHDLLILRDVTTPSGER